MGYVFKESREGINRSTEDWQTSTTIKETSTKALDQNKIKPAGQPKIDLKTYGEDKDLEYVISVTELPKIDIKSLQNIKFD